MYMRCTLNRPAGISAERNEHLKSSNLAFDELHIFQQQKNE